MSVEENKAKSRRFFETVGDASDVETGKELLVPEYRHHDPQMPPFMKESRDAYLSHLPMYRASFPDLTCSVDDMIAEGDKVVTRWTIRGTHQGDLMGIPPTGKRIEVSGITMHPFVDGKIVEGWTNVDMLGMLQQLGVVPAPGQ